MYAFGIAIVALTLGTMIMLPLLVSNHINERDARLVSLLVSQLADRYRDEDALARALADDPDLARLDLHVFDRTGTPLFGAGRPVSAPTGDELAVRSETPLVARDRVVMAVGDWVVVHRPSEPPIPTGTIFVLLGVILVLTAIATTWFARSFARPLTALAEVVRRFGAGDTVARARLARRDELGEVGDAFDEMADRIDQLWQTQGTMMADISHELRTPLTRIKLAIDLAGADPEAARQVLDDVGADLEEIEQIIDDVFAVVRLSHDAAPLPRVRFDLQEVLRRSVARFREYHPHHPLVQDITGEVATAAGDAPLVRRALDNLLDNAAKYSTGRIALGLHRDAGTWVIEIADLGIGMTAEELERAFTPFWRADGSRTRATGGVGLGLALARRVARAHGGDITLTSRLGFGTTARFTLPEEETRS